MTVRSPQQIADHVRHGMYARDRAARMLGIAIVDVRPGAATLSMTVRDDMLNGRPATPAATGSSTPVATRSARCSSRDCGSRSSARTPTWRITAKRSTRPASIPTT